MLDQAIPEISFPGQEGASPSFKRLEGKIAIITGGAGGIGEATVRLFAAHGARVIIADIEDSLGNALANSLSPHVTYVHCDVTSEADIEAVIKSTISKCGKLDILFSNAGILGGKSKNILDFDADEFDQIMRVNVRGAALGMKHAARAMIACGGSGSIICTASVAGLMGGFGPNAYTTSKHAIVGLTKNAACELGQYGIRVNCISPSGVATNMMAKLLLKKEDSDGGAGVSEEEVEKMEELMRGSATLKGEILRAKDVAEAVVFLASEESMYITGHNLVVDGGLTTFRKRAG